MASAGVFAPSEMIFVSADAPTCTCTMPPALSRATAVADWLHALVGLPGEACVCRRLG
jgi:hypothetical protein